MVRDKYSAIWISHSAISDYLRCPRAYYLGYVYRDPKTHHRITVNSPALSLGQAVHNVLDRISRLPAEDRFKTSLLNLYDIEWQKISGKRGGFKTPEDEQQAKDRGAEMLNRVQEHPEPLQEKAVRIREEIPYFWLSDEENIILCGKLDWLIYNEDSDSVTILDFKTGKFDEDPDSLQLPIYHLLGIQCQKKPVQGAQYWYLSRDDQPVDVPLPDITLSDKRIREIAQKIALARKLERFTCSQKDGCRVCKPLEDVIHGKAEFVGVNERGHDMYII